MLQPKKTKFRKMMKGRMRGKAYRGSKVSFGDFGLQALEPGRISARQIEAGRIAASHFLRGEGKVWIRIFPHKSVSSTPAETRQGTGKGDIDFWTAVVKPGTVLFEVAGVSESLARGALRLADAKLGIKTRLVKRGES